MSLILIVDDEEGMRKTLSRFVKAQGHDTLTAEDAFQAYSLLKDNKIDVVVTDVIMPRVNGIDLLNNINKKYPDIKVILITGEPSVDTANDVLRSGAFDYLSKPVNRDTFCKVVDNAANQKTLEDDNKRYRNDLEVMVQDKTQSLDDYLSKLSLITNRLENICEQETTEDLELTVLDVLARLTGSDGGRIFFFNGDEFKLTSSTDIQHNITSIPNPPPEGSLINAVFKLDKAILRKDVDNESIDDLSEWDNNGQASFMIFPCKDKQKDFKSFVYLYSKSPTAFTAHELELGKIVAKFFIIARDKITQIENPDSEESCSEPIYSITKDTLKSMKTIVHDFSNLIMGINGNISLFESSIENKEMLLDLKKDISKASEKASILLRQLGETIRSFTEI